jgi:hypothetical protein
MWLLSPFDSSATAAVSKYHILNWRGVSSDTSVSLMHTKSNMLHAPVTFTAYIYIYAFYPEKQAEFLINRKGNIPGVSYPY